MFATMLNGFTADVTKTQRGRFIKLEYAELSSIEKFVRIGRNGVVVTAPVFKAGYSWRNMPLNHGAINSYSVQMRETPQGNLYDVVMNGTTPKVDGATQAEFGNMVTPESFVVKITTPDGLKLLMSVLEFPAEFTFNTNGGDTETVLSRVSWQFKAVLTFPITQILS